MYRGPNSASSVTGVLLTGRETKRAIAGSQSLLTRVADRRFKDTFFFLEGVGGVFLTYWKVVKLLLSKPRGFQEGLCSKCVCNKTDFSRLAIIGTACLAHLDCLFLMIDVISAMVLFLHDQTTSNSECATRLSMFLQTKAFLSVRKPFNLDQFYSVVSLILWIASSF